MKRTRYPRRCRVRLAEVGGVRVLRTDRQGTVTFVTDGQRLWVETER